MRTRLMVTVPLTLALLGSIAACETTSYTSRCEDGVCTVSLSGAGADGEVNGGQLTISLDGATDGTATFAIDDQSATCAQGDELTVAGYAVTCTEVGDDKLTVEIR